MEKRKTSWNIFWQFLRIMGKPLPLFLFAMIIHMVGDNLFQVTLSVFVKNMVEMAQHGETGEFIPVLSWSLLAGFLSLMIFFFFGAVYDIEAKRGNAKVQKLVIEKALRMPMSYYDEHHGGEIVSKLLNDADVASQIFTSRLRRVTTPVMSVIVYFIPMFLMNRWLAVSLLFINIISLFVNSRYVKPMKQIGKDTSEKKKSMTKDIATVISGINSIKMYPGCQILLKKFRQDVEDYSDTRSKAVRMSSMLGGINTFFDVTCALGFLMLSIYFVDHDMASLSSVAAIYTLYGSFSYNFLELGKYLPELINCIARAQILFEYLESEEEEGLLEKDETQESQNEKRTIRETAVELNDVVFSYGKAESSEKEAPLYHHVNMKFSCGVSTAITGKSGCGKSTLFKLLLGFYPLRGGEIRVMGEKLTSDSVIRIREQFAYVPQRSYLFQLSVKENIRLGRETATDDDVIIAARAANAHEFIMALPDGYDTILDNGGNMLSGGERQRIAIARALVRKAPVLLMDEATSSLDNENDIQVLKAVKRVMKNGTALVIAHKPATIAECENRIALSHE